MTKREVIDYALRITGPDRIPAILAYLRVGAALNKEIAPIYHAVALAANDPMEAPDYSITALITALAASDTNYPELNDCCMGAAFLRTSFLSGRGYDYSAQGLRDSIAISQQIPASPLCRSIIAVKSLSVMIPLTFSWCEAPSPKVNSTWVPIGCFDSFFAIKLGNL